VRQRRRGFFLFGLAYGAASLGCTLPAFLAVVGSSIAAGGVVAGAVRFVGYGLGMASVLVALTVALAFFKEGLREACSLSSSASSTETEVLVVGASLAGLCAAYSAARSGARTLLIDASPEVGARSNPATLLMEPLWRRTGLPIPQGALERELSELRLGGPSGQGPLLRLRTFHLDRRTFDRAFAERAAEAGATVLGSVRVRGTLPSGGVLADEGPMRARVTIFADGANSAAREIMPTVRNPQEMAWGLSQILEAPGLGEPSCFEVRFGSFAPGWRAQLNPLGGDRASLWTFARGIPREELGAYAERARKVFLGPREVRIVEESGGVDPAFVVPYQIATDGAMACGAAAGQGGLESGARAGLMAGEVAARAVRAGDVSRHALQPYERTWRRDTAVESLALRWGVGALRRLSDAELDQLFERLSGVEFCEEDVLALLRGHPRGALRRVGLGRSARTVMELARGWIYGLSRDL
jgi:digeranylgeranylglycerophospholipid reductase